MADDFDKEAYDVEESSSRKETIPDLSIVKKEIFNYYDSEFESTPISVQYESSCEDNKQILQEEIKSITFKPMCKELPGVESSENKLLMCNKIILGSKPNRVSIDHNEFENMDNLQQMDYDVYVPKCSSRVSIDENYFEELVTSYEPNVVLQDVQSYLCKSKRFCKTCSILFPESSGYDCHVQTFHTEENTAPVIHRKRHRVTFSQHKCMICSKYFAAAHVLRKHMKTIHKCTNKQLTAMSTKKTEKSVINQDKSFSSSNKCFHCKETFETQKSLIEHLYEILQMKQKKTEVVPVLKSILFKCNKCDIHFTSSQIAADHAEHMDMLINWKCSICNRIFKKEDELSHERQHSVSNDFLVYNLEEIDVTRILFKCSKCSTYFTERNFLYHFRECGLDYAKSVQCTICDITLDYNSKTIHESVSHVDVNQFTIIETDIISDQPVESTLNESQMRNKLSELVNSVREVKVVLKRIDSSKFGDKLAKAESDNCDSSVSSEGVINETLKKLEDKVSEKSLRTRQSTINKHKDTSQKLKSNGNMKTSSEFQGVTNKGSAKLIKRHNLAYSYCETCKCFLTSFRTAAHKLSRCINFGKVACKFCGLMLTKRSIQTHKRLHEKNKGLKLNDFRFYNLYNGKSINPPIPEYPKCRICAVHFLSTVGAMNHICREEAYLTCQVCEMKLSEAAFRLHMKFHQYSTTGGSKILKYSQSTVTSKIGKNTTNATNKNKQLSNSLDVVDSSVHNSSIENYEIMYTCSNCSVSVDTYDKVIEHCQGHYKDMNKAVPTKFCNYCNLNIDETCYTEHHNLHEKGIEIKCLKFDSYYFPVENNMWINHVFKSLPNKKVLDILSKSIYRFECRIKMEIVQEGDPDLTLYKCDQCSCFIDPGSLYKHSDNSCFKLRQHACAWCSLPFISSASRIEHEKIHERPGITANLYRIVVFNREQDKEINRSFCLRKSYVLYKCRNCDVIIDGLQKDIHECDFKNTLICPDCGLLLHAKDYERHIKAHKEFVSFNYSNMKVIVIGGENIHNEQSPNTSKSNFRGAVYDYKMIICNKCGICIKNEKCIPKHICCFGRQRSKCLKCGIYFSVGRLKTHNKAHEHDPDFLRSNMNIVSFDPYTLDQNKNATLRRTEDNEISDSNTDSDIDVVFDDDDTRKDNVDLMVTETVEETAKVYKCQCALHFLNEDSIFRHFGVCRSKAKISKQKCPKCDLLFTPNVLFTHLLAHHSNKSRRYKYQIIEMDNTQKRV